MLRDLFTLSQAAHKLWHPYSIPVWITLYILILFTLKVAQPYSLSPDEAEQMILTQGWAWGYGTQPPLYTWLQILVFEITGPGRFGLAVLKHGLLLAIYLGVWRLARMVGADQRVAGVAMLGTLLIPTLLWSAQRDLTHTVLAVAVSIWVVIAALLALRTQTWVTFALVGVLAAASILSKWNVVFVILGGAVAILSMPQARTWRWWISVGVIVALMIRPAMWMLDHWTIATSGIARFDATDGPGMGAAAQALVSFVQGLLADYALVALLLLICFGLPAWGRADWPIRLIRRMILAAIGIIIMAALGSGATVIHQRWVLPPLVFAPMVAVFALAPSITRRNTVWFTGIGGALVLIFGLIIPQLLPVLGDRPMRKQVPIAAIAQALPDGNLVVLTESAMLAGNLRAMRPEISVGLPGFPPQTEARPIHVIWGRAFAPFNGSLGNLTSFAQEHTGQTINSSAIAPITVPYPPPFESWLYYLYIADVSQ